ncbi:hypothetical protein ACFVYC_21345 [Pseudarthrobacter sp. NPDC058329]|uniref:hypothetical protein n=1 Tax=Pseudarthrobacter sp. NPDC058329 TaxID=3346448 RepID=UPI0036DB3A23
MSSQSAGQEEAQVQAGPALSSPSPEGLGTASQAVHAVHQANPVVDPESMERDCCERRHAPRGEPAPLRTGAIDPPSLLQQQPVDTELSSAIPLESGLRALTVLQLSISRT